MDTQINLEEISKLSEHELKKHFKQWLEKDENMARKMQAKLRKDLIESFSKTSLGRKMYFQHLKSQRIVLSPLILVLNTLTAEFLYAQNCHFTLSVFCTEMPYRNLIPYFENNENFRFKKSELDEILEAINVNMPSITKENICEEYLKNSNEIIPCSLLYIVFKHILKISNNSENVHESEKIKPQHEEQKNNIENNENIIKNPNELSRNNSFRYLNKYLLILSKKVKEMSFSLNKLKETNLPPAKNLKTKHEKYEHLNKSLEKISDIIKLFCVKQNKNKKTSTIANAIGNVAKQFEKCALNFENIMRTDSIPRKYESYDQYINELQSTKFGKKFINKIETCLGKTLEDEKERIAKEFTEKLEIEKEIIKAEYKQKYLKIKTISPMKDSPLQRSDTTKIIDEKMKEINVRHEELLKIVSRSEEMIKSTILEKNKWKLVNSSNNIEEVHNVEPVQKRIVSKKLSSSEMLQEISPQLQGMANSIVQQERKIDHILFDAKVLIQELENESHQHDKNFQDHMKNIRSEKNQAEKNAISIWENYNLNKNILNLKRIGSQKNIPKISSKLTPNQCYSNETIYEIPEINVDKTVPSEYIVTQYNIENPFRTLQEKLMALEESSSENILHQKNKEKFAISSPKSFVNLNKLITDSKKPTNHSQVKRKLFPSTNTKENYLKILTKNANKQTNSENIFQIGSYMKKNDIDINLENLEISSNKDTLISDDLKFNLNLSI